MTFHFALQSLLRFRIGIEDRAWLGLQAATSAVNSARDRARKAAAVELQCRDQRALVSMVNASSSELRFASDCEHNVESIRQRLVGELAECERLCEQARGVYLLARQERESLESLREAALQVWRMELSRREQNSADDLFLLGRAFRQSGSPCPPK